MDNRTDYALLIRTLVEALGHGELDRDRPVDTSDSARSVSPVQPTGDTLTSTMFNVTQTQPKQPPPQTASHLPSVPSMDASTKDLWKSDSDDDSSRISDMLSVGGSSAWIGSQRIPSTFLSTTECDSRHGSKSRYFQFLNQPFINFYSAKKNRKFFKN